MSLASPCRWRCAWREPLLLKEVGIEAADVSAAVVAAASLALPPKSGDLRATRPDRASSSWPTNSYASSRPCRDGSTIFSDVRGPTLAIAYEPCGRPPGHGEEGFPAV